MKLPSILKLLPILPLFVGCAETDDSLAHERAINAWMIKAIQGEAVDTAIIKQRTVYPYHFVDEAAKLNNLGKSDLHVLAGHYRRYPGTLSIRQGDVPDELYSERIEAVRQYLDDSGVNLDEMQIEDNLPRGQGATNERVTKSLEKAEKDPGWGSSSSTGGSTRSSGTGGMTR